MVIDMKKFFIIIIGIGIVFTLFILIFNYTMSPLKELDKKRIGRTLVFNNKDTLYVSASSWGLAGNNEEIILSKKPIKEDYRPNKKNDYVFYTSEIYYKIDANKLVVYAIQSSILEPENFSSPINVEIKGIKTAQESKDYELNYSKYGLTKLSIFDTD